MALKKLFNRCNVGFASVIAIADALGIWRKIQNVGLQAKEQSGLLTLNVERYRRGNFQLTIFPDPYEVVVNYGDDLEIDTEGLGESNLSYSGISYSLDEENKTSKVNIRSSNEQTDFYTPLKKIDFYTSNGSNRANGPQFRVENSSSLEGVLL